MKGIYLDNAASMPMPKGAIKKISEANAKFYANPFSLHAEGINALKALTEAKKILASEMGVRVEEITLTSGGTESNAMAILGVARAQKSHGKRKILISSIEHSSAYENAKKLESEGFIVKEIPVSENEGLDISYLEREADASVAIVSIMSVNSDTGMINDIPGIAKVCKQKGAILHIDHSQGFGKIALQPKSLGVDLLTADAHKIGGPKGIGFLYAREGLAIEPLFRGGEKKGARRAGTENTAGAIGFAAALKEYKKTRWKSVEASRNALQEELENLGARITAKNARRAPTHLHVCFGGLNGEEIANYLSTKQVYCSTGSACDSDKEEKRILDNLGIPAEYLQGALRFTLARPLAKKEINKVTREIKTFLNRFKKTNSS